MADDSGSESSSSSWLFVSHEDIETDDEQGQIPAEELSEDVSAAVVDICDDYLKNDYSRDLVENISDASKDPSVAANDNVEVAINTSDILNDNLERPSDTADNAPDTVNDHVETPLDTTNNTSETLNKNVETQNDALNVPKKNFNNLNSKFLSTYLLEDKYEKVLDIQTDLLDTASCSTDTSSDVDILDESIGATDSSSPLCNSLMPTSLMLSTFGLLPNVAPELSDIPAPPDVPSAANQSTQTENASVAKVQHEKELSSEKQNTPGTGVQGKEELSLKSQPNASVLVVQDKKELFLEKQPNASGSGVQDKRELSLECQQNASDTRVSNEKWQNACDMGVQNKGKLSLRKWKRAPSTEIQGKKELSCERQLTTCGSEVQTEREQTVSDPQDERNFPVEREEQLQIGDRAPGVRYKFFKVLVTLCIVLEVVFVCFAVHGLLFRPFYRVGPLYEIQEKMVQCFGEQQLLALKEGNTTMLTSLVCVHNFDEYSQAVKSALSWRAKNYLISGVNDPEDPYFLSFKEYYDDIHVDLIIRQLQFYDLLPVKEAEKVVTVSETENLHSNKKREINTSTGDKNQTLGGEKVLKDLDQSKMSDDDLIVAKGNGYGSMENEGVDNLSMQELKRKVAWLVRENQKLQRKIDLHLAQSGAHCTGHYKEVLVDANSTTQERPSNGSAKNSDEVEDKIKPYIDEVVSSLSNQIMSLQNSLAEELKEVRKWNELVQNMTLETRHHPSAEQIEDENWSWQDIRENIENIVSDVHEDLKGKLAAFQTMNISDTFHSVVEDNKKNAEYMLNVINHYFNAAKNRTQEMLKSNEMPKSEEPELTAEGIWEQLQVKWNNVLGKFEEMTESEQPEETDENGHSADTKVDEDDIENWYFRKYEKGDYEIPSYEEDVVKMYDKHKSAEENWYLKKRPANSAEFYEKQAESDWLFKRAKNRDKRRQQQAKARRKSFSWDWD